MKRRRTTVRTTIRSTATRRRTNTRTPTSAIPVTSTKVMKMTSKRSRQSCSQEEAEDEAGRPKDEEDTQDGRSHLRRNRPNRQQRQQQTRIRQIDDRDSQRSNSVRSALIADEWDIGEAIQSAHRGRRRPEVLREVRRSPVRKGSRRGKAVQERDHHREGPHTSSRRSIRMRSRRRPTR